MRLPWWVPFGSVPEIAPGDLAVRLKQKPWPQIVDVRTPAEFAGGHVRGAVNLSISSLSSRIDSLKLDRDRPVVAVCLTAHRSRPAVRLLRERGFDAVQLSGGMRAWRSERLPEARG